MNRDDRFFFAIKHNMRGGSHFGNGPHRGGGRGRRRRGVVRIALLTLLAEEPRNGYQLMQEIEERSGGRWRPSPGAVYPALSQLEDEGLIRAVDRDGVKLFEITDFGREQLGDREDETAPWDAGGDPAGVADFKQELRQLTLAATQVLGAGSEEQVNQAVKALADARRTIYRILAEDTDE